MALKNPWSFPSPQSEHQTVSIPFLVCLLHLSLSKRGNWLTSPRKRRWAQCDLYSTQTARYAAALPRTRSPALNVSPLLPSSLCKQNGFWSRVSGSDPREGFTSESKQHRGLCTRSVAFVCEDELSLSLWGSTETGSWMKCQAHHVFHSCCVSHSESVSGPNSLHHRALKAAWVTVRHLWASGPATCSEAHVLRLHPGWCHNWRLPEHRVHSQSPKQAVAMATPGPAGNARPLLLVVVCCPREDEEPGDPCARVNRTGTRFHLKSGICLSAALIINKHGGCPRPVSFPGSGRGREGGSVWWVTVCCESSSFQFSSHRSHQRGRRRVRAVSMAPTEPMLLVKFNIRFIY